MSARPLLWIDVLGFGHEVVNNDLEETVKEYDKLINWYLHRYSGVEFDIVSDSLLFWSKDPGNMWQEFSHICQAAHLYSGSSFFLNLPIHKHSLIRGAIVFDDFLIGMQSHVHKYQVFVNGVPEAELREDKMTYHRILGKAIVYAHAWESAQEWCLISICPRYNHIIEDASIFPDYLLKRNYVIKYDIPVKNDGVRPGYVINPFTKEYCLGKEKKYHTSADGSVLESFDLIDVPKIYFNTLSQKIEVATDSKIKTKLSNTLDFYQYVVDHKLYVSGHYSPD